ncbi:hypothetical protein CC2G_008468 [Coprinopsis cinerea AmutBmut pab1-1]|nr:hypothetical protein CC2G_008468 [Coprinopsis cinerea AmutBmut pab1-1]
MIDDALSSSKVWPQIEFRFRFYCSTDFQLENILTLSEDPVYPQTLSGPLPFDCVKRAGLRTESAEGSWETL